MYGEITTMLTNKMGRYTSKDGARTVNPMVLYLARIVT